jgi:hypothetical protein
MACYAALDTETDGLTFGQNVNVVSLHDSRERQATSFVRKNSSTDHLIHAMDACERFDRIVTFNGNFDFHMIADNVDDPRARRMAARLALTNYDILLNFAANTGYMSSLESFAVGTLGEGKTANGEHAVAMWASGEHQRVIEYCENDARITSGVYASGMRLGRLTRRTKSGKPSVWPLPLGRFSPTHKVIQSYIENPPDVSWMTEPTDYSGIADWAIPLIEEQD